MKRVVILGSTGSVGRQTLQVIKKSPRDFKVIAITGFGNRRVLEEQIKEFNPKYKFLLKRAPDAEKILCELACLPGADIVVNALAGISGLLPSYYAAKAGKRIALANKESLVMDGANILSEAAKTGAKIVPIDSELSSIFRLLDNNEQKVKKIILTASGGPFWKWNKEQLSQVTVAQSLKHPTWKMGKKNTVDSATLINKAFEIMGAHFLFGIPPEKIEVLVHRQSIVHALVEFEDGTIHAAMSSPDMRLPISYALNYPEQPKKRFSELEMDGLSLTFERPDFSLLKGPLFAYEVLKRGGGASAAFCKADDIAVSKFLAGELPFLGIYDFIRQALNAVAEKV